MYYSMNGTGSIGDAVLIDSQNPTAGSYDPVTHQPITTTQAKPSLVDQLFNTANKAIDAFNPNLNTAAPAPAPTDNKKWLIPGILLVGAAVGIAYYVTRPAKSEKKSGKK